MNLETVPNQMDAEKLQCRAIIETPKGSRNKFDYDADLESFELGGLLPEGRAGDDGCFRTCKMRP